MHRQREVHLQHTPPHPKTCKQYVSRCLLARHTHILGLNSNLLVRPVILSTAPCEHKHEIGHLRKQIRHSFLGRGIPRLSVSLRFFLAWFGFLRQGRITQAILKLLIFLPPPPEYWDRSTLVATGLPVSDLFGACPHTSRCASGDRAYSLPVPRHRLLLPRPVEQAEAGLKARSVTPVSL